MTVFTTAACNRGALTQSREEPARLEKRVSNNTNLTSLTYTQLYADANGETHFRDITVELLSIVTAPPAQAVNVSGEQPATTTRFAAFEPHWGDHDRENHVLHSFFPPLCQSHFRQHVGEDKRR